MYFKPNGNIDFVFQYHRFCACAPHSRNPSLSLCFMNILRKFAKSESETINLSFCTLPEPFAGTTNQTNVIHVIFAIIFHGFYLFCIFSTRVNAGKCFITGILCLQIKLIMLVLHYVPGSHGSHGSQKRSSP